MPKLTEFYLPILIIDMEAKKIHNSVTIPLTVTNQTHISNLNTQIKAILWNNSGGIMKAICTSPVLGDEDAIDIYLHTSHA